MRGIVRSDGVTKRTLLWAGLAVLMVVVAIGIVYAIGVTRISGTEAELARLSPAVPIAGAPAATGPAAVAGSGASRDASAAAERQFPAPDPTSPFATDIPGCVCHSDDPALVAEHASYRMNQCFGCHEEGMPTGQ